MGDIAVPARISIAGSKQEIAAITGQQALLAVRQLRHRLAQRACQALQNTGIQEEPGESGGDVSVSGPAPVRSGVNAPLT
ncbi:MAG: hypothetical protein IRZ31_16415 [Thermogemmatispora sp.]|uniref:hypothetical protein n=1 Tax=Thermogemmatispora sp. TaxID=1968838 RepID=UPI00261594E1|nr:hypothetical protein [Thermogemmatispora sp.]MBX5458480.1 hypothetical protein [Thermogemmatispora sp.]